MIMTVTNDEMKDEYSDVRRREKKTDVNKIVGNNSHSNYFELIELKNAMVLAIYGTSCFRQRILCG